MSRTAVIVSDAEDSRALCRLCMIYHECFVNIFIPNDTFRICAEEAIHDLLRLKVAVGDGLPSNICHQCAKKLMEFRDFKEMCLKTAEELRKNDLDNVQRSHAKEEFGSSENALVVKEEVNDGEHRIEGDVPVNALTSVAVDPLAVDTMALKEEAQEPKGTASNGSSLSDISPHSHIQVTEVFVPVPDQLSMGIARYAEEDSRQTELIYKEEIGEGLECSENDVPVVSLSSVNVDPLAVDTTCHLEKDLRPTALMDEEEIGKELDCSENDVPKGSLSTVNVDPLVVDTETDRKEVYPRDPLADSDDCGEEDLAGTKYNDDAAVRSESNQLLIGDQGEVKKELELPEVVGNVEIHSREVIDKGDFSDTGGPILLSDILAVMGMVDYCNYVGGLPAVQEFHFDKSVSGGPEVSQSQLLNNSSSDGMLEGNTQLEYSRAHSSGAHLNPGKIMKEEKNVNPSDSNKMSIQLKDSAKFVKNHKCNQYCPQVAKKCSPAELICDYCGKRYSEIHSLALHIKGHVYRKASEIILSEKEFPRGMSSNPLVRNDRNIEKEIFEASEQSSMQMNSKSKYEKPTLDTFVKFEKIGRKVNHSNALLAETVTSLDKVGFVCDACGMAFRKKGNLVKHINIHIGLSTHKCRVSGKKFKLNSILKKHEAIHSDETRFKYDLRGNEISKKFCLRKNEKAHTVLKPVKCDISGKNFKCSAELKRHSVVHTGEKPFKCEFCGKMFTRSGHLITHLSIHTGEKPFKCEICGKMFTQSGNLKTHLLIHAGVKPYKCAVCSKMFSRSGSLNAHSVVHTGVKPFKCNKCGRMFTQSSSLKHHLFIHTGEKPFKCDICGKNFKYSAELKRHSVVHTGDKPFKCEFCGKMFGLSGNLKQHLTVHTGEKPYKCSVCGKMFSKKSNLETHMHIHTGVRPFQCHLCGKSFSDKSSLIIHSRIHTGVKPYKCDYCGKMFFDKSNLRSHLPIHTGVKQHKCAVCGKMFSQKYRLETHLRTHTGVRPFMCHLCGKSFTVKSRLKEHLPIHTGVKPHKCDKCGKEYKSRSGFRGHLVTHADVQPSM